MLIYFLRTLLVLMMCSSLRSDDGEVRRCAVSFHVVIDLCIVSISYLNSWAEEGRICSYVHQALT